MTVSDTALSPSMHRMDHLKWAKLPHSTLDEKDLAMPEVVTRFPASARHTLIHAGAKCGEGVKQQILTKCPPSQFCATDAGEFCIYTVDQIPLMTQMSVEDFAEVVSGVPSLYSHTSLLLGVMIFGLGMVIGMWLNKRR